MSRIAPLALALVLGSGLAVPGCTWAQVASDSTPVRALPDSLPPYVPHGAPPEHAIRWYEPLAVAGGLGLISALDQPMADHIRLHQSSGGQSAADTWSKFGTPVVYGPVTVGILAGGLIAHDREVTQAGMRLAFSLLLAGVSNQALKAVVGRERHRRLIPIGPHDDGVRHGDLAGGRYPPSLGKGGSLRYSHWRRSVPNVPATALAL
jgi:hypothetical protein